MRANLSGSSSADESINETFCGAISSSSGAGMLNYKLKLVFFVCFTVFTHFITIYLECVLWEGPRPRGGMSLLEDTESLEFCREKLGGTVCSGCCWATSDSESLRFPRLPRAAIRCDTDKEVVGDWVTDAGFDVASGEMTFGPSWSLKQKNIAFFTLQSNIISPKNISTWTVFLEWLQAERDNKEMAMMAWVPEVDLHNRNHSHCTRDCCTHIEIVQYAGRCNLVQLDSSPGYPTGRALGFRTDHRTDYCSSS